VLGYGLGAIINVSNPYKIGGWVLIITSMLFAIFKDGTDLNKGKDLWGRPKNGAFFNPILIAMWWIFIMLYSAAISFIIIVIITLNIWLFSQH
jgi:hypothetical protein